MSAMDAKSRDDGKQKMDNNPIIENKALVEGKKSNKMMFLLVLLVFLLAAAAGGAWAFKHFNTGNESGKLKGASGKELKHEVKAVLAMDPFLVNLADAGEVRFLKATFQLGMAEPVSEEASNSPEVAAMRDSIISLLSSKTADQILSPEGKEKLREEIRSRVNAIASENSVAEVYIVDFVVQL